MGEVPEVVEAAQTPPTGEVAPAATPAELVHVTGTEPAEAMLWRHFASVATTLISTDFVPLPYRNQKAAVMACLAYGHELGLGPMQSLQSIDVIQGKPTLKPEMMRALIRAAGHSLERIEASGERVTFRGRRRDTGDEETVTFTLEDARGLGLLGKDNWKKQPRAMLTARCTAEIARSLFSDVIMGASYTPEELGDETPAVETTTRMIDGPASPEEDLRRPAFAEVVGETPVTALKAGEPWNWHSADGEPVCNACTHLVLEHTTIRRGCRWCACKQTEWHPPIPGAASPAPFQGEGEPAPQGVQSETPVPGEGSPPPPELTTVSPATPPGAPDGSAATGPTDGTVTPHTATPSVGSAPLSEKRRRQLHAAMGDVGFGDDERHCIVEYVTRGRSRSSNDLSDDEAVVVLNVLGKVKQGAVGLVGSGESMTVAATNRMGADFLRAIERPVEVA